MGARLGKTVSSVEAAYRAGKGHILVVAPVTILDGWIEEIHTWWRGDSIPIRKAHGLRPEDGDIAGWTFTNYETLRGRLIQVGPASWRIDWPVGYDLIILDESVKIKSPKAKVAQAAHALVKANRWACRWLLSANPSPKDLSDLWTQLSIAAPAQTGLSYWNFAHRYCDVRVTAWGTKIVGNLPDGVERLMEDFRGALWSPPREIAPELTPIHTRVVEVPLWGDQLRVYLEMEAQFKALLDEQTGDTLLAPNTMVQGLRLMQLATNPGLVGGEIGHLAGARLAGGRLLPGRFLGASPREERAGRGGRTAGDGEGTRDNRPRGA